MRYSIIMALTILMACNSEMRPVDKTGETQNPEKAPDAKAWVENQVETNADVNSLNIAELDMGSYIFRVHEVIRFAPDEMQSRMMKWNDAEKDYYIIDGSVENKTAETLDTGRDMLSAYFQLSDGSVFKNILRGAGVLASYQVIHKRKYPQQQYDMIWKSKFPANSKARAHVFGVETPEGALLTGIGFYQNNAARKKYTDFK